jgi:hypothetical protein
LAVAVVFLHGLVMQGPTQPVCQVGVPCSKPAANVLLVFTRRGTTTKVRTDGKGRYSIRLTRGTYTVTMLPARTIGRGVEPRSFTAHGTSQRLDFDVDTGIR